MRVALRHLRGPKDLVELTLRRASVVPERSLGRQTCVRPALQVASPAEQSIVNRFLHCLTSVLRTLPPHW
jgi:hypothetical protein